MWWQYRICVEQVYPSGGMWEQLGPCREGVDHVSAIGRIKKTERHQSRQGLCGNIMILPLLMFSTTVII